MSRRRSGALWLALLLAGCGERGRAAVDATAPADTAESSSDDGPATEDTPPGDARATGPVTPAPERVPLPAGYQPPDGCPAPRGLATLHSDATITDARWTADDGPHVFRPPPGGTTITGTLALGPCADVLMTPGALVHVDGRLAAEGEPGAPVWIRRAETARAWQAINVRAGGRLSLVHTTIAGGGLRGTVSICAGATICAGGGAADGPRVPRLHMDTVELLGSAGLGMLVEGDAGFTAGSRALIIAGSARAPLSLPVRALGQLPAGRYDGNGSDHILVSGAGVHAVGGDLTVPDRGVPYTLAGALEVVTRAPNMPPALLTLAPGVVLRFPLGAGLLVEPDDPRGPARGALVAAGTAERPILLTTSAGNAGPGDWQGVFFGGVPDPRNRLAHVRIENAGSRPARAESCPVPGRSAATAFAGGAIVLADAAPAAAFISDVTIVSSAGHGIVRGWRGPPAPDLLRGNRFAGIPLCLQSFPVPEAGPDACASYTPCPGE